MLKNDKEFQEAIQRAWRQGMMEAAAIAAKASLHSGSFTIERDWANKLCPKIAKAIENSATSGVYSE